ncbi:MAG: Gfo/Idh/MocA family oxidoreductase [Bacteroidia bacterium]|nr:Gfo/Idh/MocA family oxidoreductase [Bacteroidia bacterium]
MHPEPTPIRTALLAYGMSGEVFHAPILHVHPGFELRSILRRSRPEPLARYPAVQVTDDAEAIFSDPDIELIVVNTPEYTHHELARRALLAGKHVVVEKAFTVTENEAQDLIALAEAQGRMLTVYQSRRWDGDFMTIRQLLASGVLGRVVRYEARYDRWRPEPAPGWKEEGRPGTGILYNLGSHLIDQAIALFGYPESVMADVRIQRSGGRSPDCFDLWMQYPAVQVRLSANYLTRLQAPRFRILGDQGAFVKYGTDPQEAALKAGRYPGEPGWGLEPEPDWGELATGPEHAPARKVPTLPGNYAGFYDGVYASVRMGAPPPVPVLDSLMKVRVIEAAMRSAAEGAAASTKAPA